MYIWHKFYSFFIIIIDNNGLYSMRKLPNEKVKTNGETPSPRFGHTFTMVSKTKGVLFGGAVSMAGIF